MVRRADALADDPRVACRRLDARLEATPAVTLLLEADDVSPMTSPGWN